jgi:hypothetical protein
MGQGLWHFTVMPFELCNAPATFERLIESVLRGLTYDACLVYLDDFIFIPAHFKNSSEICGKSSKDYLKLNAAKFQLFHKDVRHLGHIVSCQELPRTPRSA